MISSFKTTKTKEIFERERLSGIPEKLQRVMQRKLLMLHAAHSLEDLKVPPGNRLEKLLGKMAGKYSIRVNDQWRICFRWEKGSARDVELVDYH